MVVSVELFARPREISSRSARDRRSGDPGALGRGRSPPDSWSQRSLHARQEVRIGHRFVHRLKAPALKGSVFGRRRHPGANLGQARRGAELLSTALRNVQPDEPGLEPG